VNTTVDSSGDTWDCTGNFDASGGANASTTITASMTVDPGAPEQLEATVIADPDNAITESDETNNTKSEQTTVTGSECTSLSCVDLVSSVFGDPVIFSNIGVINYSATVANIGTSAVSDSPAWTVEVNYVGVGTPLVTPPAGVTCTPAIPPNTWDCVSAGGSPDPMALAPGAGLTFLVQVVGATTPGAAILTVNADSTNVVTEFSEANNLSLWTTTILPPPGP
jgi:subtilase family serine protease